MVNLAPTYDWTPIAAAGVRTGPFRKVGITGNVNYRERPGVSPRVVRSVRVLSRPSERSKADRGFYDGRRVVHAIRPVVRFNQGGVRPAVNSAGTRLPRPRESVVSVAANGR
jgi:hypothetical protein